MHHIIVTGLDTDVSNLPQNHQPHALTRLDKRAFFVLSPTTYESDRVWTNPVKISVWRASHGTVVDEQDRKVSLLDSLSYVSL